MKKTQLSTQLSVLLVISGALSVAPQLVARNKNKKTAHYQKNLKNLAVHADMTATVSEDQGPDTAFDTTSGNYSPAVNPRVEQEQEQQGAPQAEEESQKPKIIGKEFLAHDEPSAPQEKDARNVASEKAEERAQAIDKELDASEDEQEPKALTGRHQSHHKNHGEKKHRHNEYDQEGNVDTADESLDASEGMPQKESSTLYSIDREFDAEFKKNQVMHLIDKGVAYLQKQPLDKALNAFNNDQQFKSGELYIFVFDHQGVCLANAQENDLTWKNLWHAKGQFNAPYVEDIIAKGDAGGGWINYKWRNATRLVYVKEAKKDGKKYLLCAGYCPHSKADSVINLVKRAVAYFNDMLRTGRNKDDALSTLNYPLGEFIFGDLYLYAMSQKGVQVVHGELPGIVGTNVLGYQDKNGKFVNQEIIAKLKNADLGTGIWVEYISRNAIKRTYAERIVDKNGDNYYMACGFYPDANRNKAIDLVDRGYRYMKSNGKTQAAAAFSDILTPDFRYGDIALSVFTLTGKCIANGNNPSLVGKEITDFKSDDGVLYVKEFIKRALASNGAWVDYKEKNTYKSEYVEKIDLGTEKYIICAGIYPITKRETMLLTVKAGADYLNTHPLEQACGEFVKTDSSFVRGDLDILLLDSAGICFTSGNDYDAIWKNLMNSKDDNGKLYIKLLINTIEKTKQAQSITYKLNGQIKLMHGELVEKNGTSYIVSSGFYF